MPSRRSSGYRGGGVIAAFNCCSAAAKFGRPVPTGRVGRGQLLAGRMLAPGAHQVVGLHGEGQAAQALCGTRSQRASCIVRRCRGGPFEARDGLVDLYADAGATLRVVRVGLGQHEVTGELGGGHRGSTERCQSASRPCRRVRAMSRATRTAASTMTTARRTQPQAVELDDVLAAVVLVVVVGCVVVVDGRARVVVVAGTVVVVAGMVVVVGATVVVVAGAVVVVVAGAVVVVVVSCADAALATRPNVIGADVIATTRTVTSR